MKEMVLYLTAAFFEIGGCFSYWAWLRMHRSGFWIVPGTIALLLFAFTLTRIDVSKAGRAYAAYGGIYIVSSLCWLWAVEKTQPDRWDLLGAGLCILGAGVILFGPRSASLP